MKVIERFQRVTRRLGFVLLAAIEGLVRQRLSLTRLYYATASPAFRREQRAFMAGKNRYANDHHGSIPPESAAGLRRNVHRVEKGLCMRPRRDDFAKEYIEETVAVLRRQLARDSRQDTERSWAIAVLSDYFSIAGSHHAIDNARTEFVKLDLDRPESDQLLVPYKRQLSESPPITYDGLLALAHRRRSVRWFLQRQVPRDLIDKAIEVAAQAPSACNRQPFVFRVFDQPLLVKQVAAVPMGTAGYADNIPTIVVVVGQMRHFFDERDRHLIYLDSALAAMSFAFALETLGLSSCMINWPDIERLEQRMVSLIGLADDERPVMLIAVGYPDPDGLVAASAKKPLHLIRRYN